ncbi:TPA: LD-carboxypeptidase [Clostridium perfringens]|uniref:S66 peptidase family protein n=1 Tax=Clostridium perfringens TaxID=1502 RepID=UPI001157B099|nr:LD-carboxypeptidase [Clostridium perfringens]EJT5929083.1 LD-carboxypeptidase [Clostridium perfringens]EJT6483855.1 LD-carboxypeptidase [Clostridium perfringens]MDM0912662.1 LD-carboxypeptidase [Clostridium perfringens]MDM0944551.1 LD-carboxypeptidase [Clostridium perfringens]MDU2325438.1 LD-carboxypeptidase [Clostridium perfringens]
MVKFQKLKVGDTIGIVSPASGDSADVINYNISSFKNLGFKIKEGKYLRRKNDYLAASDKERAEDLMEMFKNKEVKAIIAYRGGYGCIRMLPYLDMGVIKKNPKILCGYSDLTVLLNYLSQKTGLITFHGPMINSKISSDEITKNSFLSLLTDESNLINISTRDFKVENKELFRGILCGGNLTMICSTLGTPYEINTRNKILMIEDVNEENYAIDRYLMQLKLSGKLDSCRAFLIGYFTPYNPKTINTILSILLPYKKPIIYNIPFGHDYPNITLPIGSSILFDAAKDKLIIKY